MTHLDQEIFFALRNVHRKFKARVENEVAPLNLTPVQANIIAKLHHNRSMQLSALANSLDMTFPNCSVVCGRLERDGYIKRERDKEDRRIVNLSLTECGEKVFERLKDVVTNMNKIAFQHLEYAEQEYLLEALNRLSKLL